MSVIEVGVVDTCLAAAMLSGRGARVYTCTCVHDNIRVDVYQSRPLGASLLTTSPQQGCLALTGQYTGWLGVVMDFSAVSTGGVLVQ